MSIPRRHQAVDSPATESDAAAPAEGAPMATSPTDRPDRPSGVERTRTSATFNSLVAGAIVLILLLVFILENTQSVKVSYFGATARVSLGVAVLLAAVAGALLVGLAGAARVVQLRHRIKRPRA